MPAAQPSVAMNAIPKYLLLVIAIPALALAAATTCNLLVMARVNELWSKDDILREWDRGNMLVSALIAPYPREEISRKIAPEITVLGSSRSFNLHDFAFSRSFFNLTGRFGTVGIVKSFQGAPQLLAEHGNPRYVFIFLDYWWFMTPTTDKGGDGAVMTRRNQGNPLWGALPQRLRQILSAATLPTTLLRQGLLSIGNYRAALGGQLHGQDGIRRVGLTAYTTDTGIGPDGAYYGLRLREGDYPGKSCLYVNDLEARRRLPHGAYQPGQRIDPARMAAAREMIHRLEVAGIRTITIIPPLAPSMAALYRSDSDYAYIDQWRNLAKAEFGKIWDFHDPRDLESGECEFMDDIHGGDVTYLRILDHIGKEDADVKSILNADLVSSLIKEFEGRNFVTSRGLWTFLPPLPPPLSKAPPDGVTVSPPTAPPRPRTIETMRAERREVNDTFLADMPDYPKRVYDIVATVKRTMFQGWRLGLALTASALFLAAMFALWLLRIRRSLPAPSQRDAFNDNDLAQLSRRQKLLVAEIKSLSAHR
ncbi:hypothetical protein CU669_11080 [Paramagnetospirillum kuznetsovii]|uniref:Uncharacterized protein n=1 Tax=Paramagnetospirillum kuznetsovii TaxID=2053833 RepID=A0A364NXM9_9PROT|nr:hypothetical protein [Paramagnetospirillum kuznetsovii]RAU21842.1 hypothetical protein CU669_11080 [Paramagnetospirillum kuznetsovii]